MKTTPFTQKHIALGAKMAEFAGYNMPISYEGLIIEHNNVRNAVGVFDVSHMGEFRAKGPKAFEFRARLCACTVFVMINAILLLQIQNAAYKGIISLLSS